MGRQVSVSDRNAVLAPRPCSSVICVTIPVSTQRCDVRYNVAGRPPDGSGCVLLQVWCTAIPLYAVMPASIEWAAEQGWTRAYSR